eukprot:6482054-Amphidinium_carterae.1
MTTTPEERQASIPLPPMIGEGQSAKVQTVESSTSNNSSSNDTSATTAMMRAERQEEEDYWENIIDI